MGTNLKPKKLLVVFWPERTSDLWSWDDSLQLVSQMDSIRKMCGIIYPKHDL